MYSEYDPDPKIKWDDKVYDESRLDGLSNSERARLETARDMDKPVEQLVCDVHEEIHNSERTELQNIASAQKRIASLMARVSKSNARLTWAVLCLAVVQIMVTLV